MHRLARCRTLGQRADFGLETGQFGQFGVDLVDDSVAIEFGGSHLAGEPAIEPAFRLGWTVFPWDDLELDLTDGVRRRLRARGIGIEPAFTGKGEDIHNRRMGQDHLFGQAHHFVFLHQGGIAAGADIGGGLFGFGFHKEFDAIVVFAEGGENGHDGKGHSADCNHRHDRIADDELDEVTKGRVLMAGIHRFFVAGQLGGLQGDRGAKGRQDKDQSTNNQRGGACRFGREKIARVQHLHGPCKHPPQRHRHESCTHPPGRNCAQASGHMFKDAAHPARDTTHDRKVDQRNHEGGGENEDQRDGQHAHEFTGHAGPEQHGQERAERRCGRGYHRPEHALGGLDVGVHRARALADALVGVFHHHDGAIHQHAHCKDQTEHHDVRNADTHHRKKGKTQQERGRDGKTNQQRGAAAKRGEHHDHHQCHRRQNGALKLADH